MLDERARWLNHLDVELKPSPPKAPAVPLQKILPHLQTYFEAGEAYRKLRGDRAVIRLNDLKLHKDRIILLFQYADTSASDPAFAHMETGKIRTEPKLDGEGIAVTAHLIISTSESVPGTDVYPAVLERIPGLSRSRIQEFLTYLLRLATAGHLHYDDEKGRERAVRPLVRLNPHAAETLREGLRTGELKEIEVVTYEFRKKELDENDVVKERLSTLKLRMSPRISLDTAIQQVKDQFSRAQTSGANDFIVRVKSDGRTYPMSVPLDTPDPVETTFSKVDYVSVEDLIPTCSETIHDGLTRAMTTRLKGRSG